MEGKRTIRNNCALNNRAQKLGALREPKSFESTSNGVDKAESCSLVREVGLDLVVVDIICNVLQNLVGFGPSGGLSSVSRHLASTGVCSVEACNKGNRC